MTRTLLGALVILAIGVLGTLILKRRKPVTSQRASMESRVKHLTAFIHGSLVFPVLMILIATLIFRACMGIIIEWYANFYNAWPDILKLGINVTVAFGVVVACEIISLAAFSMRNAGKRSQTDILTADMPIFRGNAASQELQKRDWQRKQQIKADALTDGIKLENRMVGITQAISIGYGVNYATITLLNKFLPAAAPPVGAVLTVLFDFLSVCMVPFFLNYLTNLREPKADLAEKSEGHVNTALEARLQVAGANVLGPNYTEQDVNMLDVVLDDGHPYKRLVKALRKGEGAAILTTRQIFEAFGIADESMRSMMRRKINKAGAAGLHGIYREGKEWRVPETAIGPVLMAEIRRHMERQQLAVIHATHSAQTPPPPDPAVAGGASSEQTDKVIPAFELFPGLVPDAPAP